MTVEGDDDDVAEYDSLDSFVTKNNSTLPSEVTQLNRLKDEDININSILDSINTVNSSSTLTTTAATTTTTTTTSNTTITSLDDDDDDDDLPAITSTITKHFSTEEEMLMFNIEDLKKFIDQLERSNMELATVYANDDPDPVYYEAITENMGIIDRKQRELKVLEDRLIEKQGLYM
ncbi:hypothetical protein SAMD00019534_055850 [Acytostelium subglobosum LB1]|uniref:hypothetical protein n=1 Tax=Acytostelium subglobosum LB1 TaxID=1410327 RepID=UPI000644FCBA|nr:hypothetical protein SAMD00019534_055850 [Acytostelium subglobosum LB1]GAM22410.1 hypothetical protein SAMD00019534_055850 [Acytostelium subglobosum LB1]|eukprot:XP_012754530.1 hypothetical protein SAMD00019534_055850 [Acytostelium subglobosum LB1]